MARGVLKVWNPERLKDTAELLELNWPLQKIAYAIRVHPQALYSRLSTDPVLRALRPALTPTEKARTANGTLGRGDRVQVVNGKRKRSLIEPLPAVAAVNPTTTFVKRSRNVDVNPPVPPAARIEPKSRAAEREEVPLAGQRLIPLTDLTEGVCRWPSKADASVVGGQLFCGRAANGRYCPAHTMVAAGTQPARVR